MTHSLHRLGSKGSLQKDFVFLAFTDPAGKAQNNYKGSLEERFKKLVKICAKFGPAALAPHSKEAPRFLKGWKPSMDSGTHRSATLNEVISGGKVGNAVNAVYTDRESLEGLLKELKEADLGISITISGLFDEVFEACKNVDLEPNAVQMSLGTWGKKDLLPEDQTLELCTMCGHGKISAKLAEDIIGQVKKGTMASDEAAVELGKQCTCNLLNTIRARKILHKRL